MLHYTLQQRGQVPDKNCDISGTRQASKKQRHDYTNSSHAYAFKTHTKINKEGMKGGRKQAAQCISLT
jgi:hypothetical protein